MRIPKPLFPAIGRVQQVNGLVVQLHSTIEEVVDHLSNRRLPIFTNPHIQPGSPINRVDTRWKSAPKSKLLPLLFHFPSQTALNTHWGIASTLSRHWRCGVNPAASWPESSSHSGRFPRRRLGLRVSSHCSFFSSTSEKQHTRD